MNIPRPPHNWKVSAKQAIAIQNRLRPLVLIEAPNCSPRILAGIDAAFSKDGSFCIAGVVLWDLKKKAVVSEHVARVPLLFPYVPGLLSFREGPAIVKVLRSIKQRPDCLVCDGHGLMHPRGMGIACHIGILTNLPAIGCAKTRLLGDHLEPRQKRGSRSSLYYKGEKLGCVLRTKDRVRPIFVSVGHKMDLSSAEKLVLKATIGYRLPEPTRLADQLVAKAKKKYDC